MKPLSANKLQEFLQRFDNFKACEFRSLEVISPLQMDATFAVQDAARDFDWLTIKLSFSKVSDAKLLENSKLTLVDTDDGITLFYDDDKFYFALGNYANSKNITNSNCYIISQSIKYKEGSF